MGGGGGGLRDGGIVKRSIEDEEGDVSVGSPEVREEAEDADGGGERDEEGEDERGAGVVEDEADEGDAEEAAEGEGDVEEVVDGFGGGVAVQQVRVLRPDGGDEVVDSCHLHGREEGDEDEPWAADLLEGGAAVEDALEAAGLLLLLLLFLLVALGLGLVAGFGAEEAGRFGDGALVA